MARRALLAGGAVVVGAALGWTAARRTARRFRHHLFSPRPLKRLAALGFLEAHASPESVRMLRDYLDWERHPMLRRRAAALLRRLHAQFG